MERLKSILDGSYLITPSGDVYSLKSQRYLCQQDNGRGYKFVNICIDGVKKQFYVHRLVAEAFIENPYDYPEVNHKDEDPGNNCMDNLEWCTSKYNKNYGHRAKKFSLSRGVPVMCVETGQVFHGIREAGRATGVCTNSICACCSGYRGAQTAGGFHWRYADDTRADWNG